MPDTIGTSSEDISFDAFDERNSPRPSHTDFDAVVDRALSRRSLLGGAIAFGASAFVMGTTSLTPTSTRAAAHAAALKRRMTHPVIGCAFLFVRQNAVGFI